MRILIIHQKMRNVNIYRKTRIVVLKLIVRIFTTKSRIVFDPAFVGAPRMAINLTVKVRYGGM